MLSRVPQVVVSVVTRGEPNGVTRYIGRTAGEFGKKNEEHGGQRYVFSVQ